MQNTEHFPYTRTAARPYRQISGVRDIIATVSFDARRAKNDFRGRGPDEVSRSTSRRSSCFASTSVLIFFTPDACTDAVVFVFLPPGGAFFRFSEQTLYRSRIDALSPLVLPPPETLVNGQHGDSRRLAL